MKNEGYITDEVLIEKIKLGDDNAFRLLFNRYYKKSLNLIYRYVKDVPTAEDLTQVSFVKFWKKRNNLDIQTNIFSYFRRICINETLTYLANNKRFIFSDSDVWDMEISEDPFDEKEVQLKQEELEQKLGAAINNLPEKCRIVFMLNRFEYLPHKEIAEKLNISTKTIENHMTKALKLLKDVMLQSSVITALCIFFKIF